MGILAVVILALVGLLEAGIISLWIGGGTLGPWTVEAHRPLVAINPAAALVIITSVAVAIERAIEFLWTGVGMMAGSFWPLTAISKHVTSLTDELGASVLPSVTYATTAIDFLKEKGKILDDEAQNLKQPLEDAVADLQKLQSGARDSQALESFAAGATDRVNLISAQYEAVMAMAVSAASTPDDRLDLAKKARQAEATLQARKANPQKLRGPALEQWAQAQGVAARDQWVQTLPPDETDRDNAVRRYINQSGVADLRYWGETAGTAVAGVSDFLGTFKDNPGRRLLSILLGVVAGLAAAGIAGLDVFAGVQNDGLTDPKTFVAATVAGIIFTGIMLGLGSNPTHEVIKVLQTDKERRKLANAPTGGTEPGSADAVGSGPPPPGPAGAALQRDALGLDVARRGPVVLHAHPTDSTVPPIVIGKPVRVRFR